jgi:hypothetical protein
LSPFARESFLGIVAAQIAREMQEAYQNENGPKPPRATCFSGYMAVFDVSIDCLEITGENSKFLM